MRHYCSFHLYQVLSPALVCGARRVLEKIIKRIISILIYLRHSETPSLFSRALFPYHQRPIRSLSAFALYFVHSHFYLTVTQGPSFACDYARHRRPDYPRVDFDVPEELKLYFTKIFIFNFCQFVFQVQGERVKQSKILIPLTLYTH